MRSLLFAVVLLLAACASHGGGATAGGCSRPEHDPFDPRSGVHILGGAVPPPYLTSPPTSGEHQPVNALTYLGRVATPIAPQIQVALLESSLVVVQYQPAVGAQPLAPLAVLPLVTLAPNPTLPAPIVASAWLWRLQCTGPAAAALPALRAFVAAHAGKGPQPAPRPS